MKSTDGTVCSAYYYFNLTEPEIETWGAAACDD